MKTRISIAFLAVAILLVQVAMAQETSHPDGLVAYCFDGDTIKLRDRRVVRLAGIDAPETAHNDKPAQYYSRQSRELLESLLRGKTVSLEFPGISSKDRHGRLVANVLLPSGESVNELMVANGAAFFYPHRDLGPEFQEMLAKAQSEAIAERKGMWERILSLPLAEQPYVGNKASLRFFPIDCQVAHRLKPRNRENFGTLMDAFLSGYAPARMPEGGPACNFWPLEKDMGKN